MVKAYDGEKGYNFDERQIFNENNLCNFGKKSIFKVKTDDSPEVNTTLKNVH